MQVDHPSGYPSQLSMLGGQKFDPCARDTFHLAGPVHIDPVDWSLAEHRRAVAASLAQGVCILERCGRHHGLDNLAPAWWEFFHFQLIDTLIDPDDSSIFGAIFENKLFSECDPSNPDVPRYVFAFRGSIMRRRTCSSDIRLDIRVILHRLCMSLRYQVAIQAVENMVGNFGHGNIWLAGHSLGSAIALQVGKDMARKDIFLAAYLFNPPFPCTPLERFQNQRLKDGIRYARSLITARLAVAVKGYGSHSTNRDKYDPNFVMLSSWIPHLFVNPSDPLCSEYIGYFEHREKMAEMGYVDTERVASQNSLVSLVSWAIGKYVEPTHLIPSASLTINRSFELQGFKQVHGIHQWWKPNQDLECKLYQLT